MKSRPSDRCEDEELLPARMGSDGSAAIKTAGRYGVLIVDGQGACILRRRYWPRWPSLWDQWFDERWRRLPRGSLRLYFNQPRSAPGFMVLAYAQAGPRTSLATLRSGLKQLENIAVARRLQAIVCQATHRKLTDRVMGYFGYQRHALSLAGRHYIKRLRPEQ